MLTQPAATASRGRSSSIGDWATERPYKDYLPYLVAKGGLTTMTLALAKELAPHIPVAMIQPAMIDAAPRPFRDDKQAVLDATPLRRFGSPSDVNRLILYLLDGTNFVTGVCYRVDGGRFLGVETKATARRSTRRAVKIGPADSVRHASLFPPGKDHA